MTEYQRFVAYLYEYQRGVQRKNSGFIRIQMQKKSIRMEINIRCPGLVAHSECKIYGFVRKEKFLQGILLGKCSTKEHQITALLEIDREILQREKLSFKELSGIILITQDGAYFGSAWDDQPICMEHFMEEKEELEEKEKIEEKVEQKQKEETFTPFADSEFVKCWKLQPCHLEKVIKTNPFLKANRFIMYGYAGYGYLLMAQKRDGQYILGVPGNYDQQECFMAGIFGFPYFKESATLRLHKNGGYWYRLINPPDFYM